MCWRRAVLFVVSEEADRGGTQQQERRYATAAVEFSIRNTCFTLIASSCIQRCHLIKSQPSIWDD